MSFNLAHNSKKTNYKELFSVAQCARIFLIYSYIYYISNYFFWLKIKKSLIIKK